MRLPFIRRNSLSLPARHFHSTPTPGPGEASLVPADLPEPLAQRRSWRPFPARSRAQSARRDAVRLRGARADLHASRGAGLVPPPQPPTALQREQPAACPAVRAGLCAGSCAVPCLRRSSRDTWSVSPMDASPFRPPPSLSSHRQ